MAYKQNVLTYTEATYTPEIKGEGTDPTVTYTTQNGRYIIVGNLIYINFNIVINTISGGTTDIARITIPQNFAHSNMFSALHLINVDWRVSSFEMLANADTTRLQFITVRDNGAIFFILTQNLANGDTLRGTVVGAIS